MSNQLDIEPQEPHPIVKVANQIVMWTLFIIAMLMLPFFIAIGISISLLRLTLSWVKRQLKGTPTPKMA
jgi:hypothetical protein